MMLFLSTNLYAADISEAIGLYHDGQNEDALMAIQEIVPETNPYENYWFGRIYEANDKMEKAVEYYNASWKCANIFKDDNEKDKLFYNSRQYKDLLWRLCNYYNGKNSKEYLYFYEELKKTGDVKWINRLQGLEEEQVLAVFKSMKEETCVQWVYIKNEWAVIQTDACENLTPDPRFRYYFKKTGVKWKYYCDDNFGEEINDKKMQQIPSEITSHEKY